MTIEQIKVVDYIGKDQETGDAVLTVSDHLEWDNTKEHCFLIQEKLNSYLRFIESGEMLDRFPDTGLRAIRFHIYFKFSPPRDAETFLNQTKRFLEKEASVLLQWEVFSSEMQSD